MADGKEITLKISAQTGSLNKALSDAAKRIDDFSKEWAGGVTALAESVGKLILRFSLMTAPITGAAAAIYYLAQKTANAGDELNDMSKRTGVAVESLSALKYAAELSGSSIEGVALGLKFLGKNMADARSGTGDAANTFKALGISVVDSNGKLRSMEEVFLQLSDKFADIEDGAGKTDLAMRLFGRSGLDLIPLMNEGGDSIRKMTAEAQKLGLVFSKDAASAADQFNDNMRKLRGEVEGIAHSIGNTLIPSLNRLMETGLFGVPVATTAERVNGLTKRIDILNDALIRLYDKRKHGGDIEALDKQIKNIWGQKTALQNEIDKLNGVNTTKAGGGKVPMPIIADQGKIDALNKGLSADLLNREKSLYGEALEIVRGYEVKKKELRDAGATDFMALDKWLFSALKMEDEKQAREDKENQEKKLASDNEYHLKKWQAETEWAAKERELQGKPITESLADTNKALTEEIQLHLELIDLKEKEGQISPLAAINQKVTYERALLSIQEDALKNAEAYTLEWYAAAAAVAKTREQIAAVTQSKISIAIDILSSPTKAIEEGVRYLANVLSSIPEKLKVAWEGLKGLFTSSAGSAKTEDKNRQQNALLNSLGKIGDIIKIAAAIANLPDILHNFIKSFMQALFDFPKALISLFDNIIAKFPRMIFAILHNLVNSLPAIIKSIIQALYNFIISTIYGLLSWIPGLKLDTKGDSSGLDENTEVVSELTKSIIDLNDSINKQITEMLTSSASPASAIERLQIAWGEVSKTKEAFLSATGKGKVEAGKGLQEALRAYLNVAQEAYQRPSEEYQQAFNATVKELQNIQAGLADIDTTDSGSWYSIEFDSGEFTKFFSSMWEGLKNIFSSAWEALKKIFNFNWPSFPSFNWPSFPSFKWPPMPEIKIDIPDLGGGGGGLGIEGDIFGIDFSFHDGGAIKKAHTGLFIKDLASYEVPIIAKVGEGILNDYNGMKAIGGEAGLDYANKTGRMMGGGSIVNNYSVSPQVTINTRGEVDTAFFVRQIIRATEESLKYGRMRQIVNS